MWISVPSLTLWSIGVDRPGLHPKEVMTLANTCIIVASLLPIVCAGLAKSKGFGKRRREGGYDNHQPRAWLATLSGWQARANAAQANSFEALPLFIAGVLAAQQMQAPQATVDALALGFIAARVGYIGVYLADLAALRSLIWFVGLGCSIALFFVGVK
jgi:uncharacterized MAPEG superfamily protein